MQRGDVDGAEDLYGSLESQRGRRCSRADVLLRRAGADDDTKAIALQDEALEIARELGMRTLMERVLARREILNA